MFLKMKTKSSYILHMAHTQQMNQNRQMFSISFVLSFYMQLYTDDILLPKFKVVFS